MSVRAWLIGVELFVGVSAVPGGLCLLAAPNGDGLLRLPLSLLRDSPFPNYMVPGLLLVMVGGSNLAGAALAWRRARSAARASLFAGLATAAMSVSRSRSSALKAGHRRST